MSLNDITSRVEELGSLCYDILEQLNDAQGEISDLLNVLSESEHLESEIEDGLAIVEDQIGEAICSVEKLLGEECDFT
jgi:hypothetical protein